MSTAPEPPSTTSSSPMHQQDVSNRAELKVSPASLILTTPSKGKLVKASPIPCRRGDPLASVAVAS